MKAPNPLRLRMVFSGSKDAGNAVEESSTCKVVDAPPSINFWLHTCDHAEENERHEEAGARRTYMHVYIYACTSDFLASIVHDDEEWKSENTFLKNLFVASLFLCKTKKNDDDFCDIVSFFFSRVFVSPVWSCSFFSSFLLFP